MKTRRKPRSKKEPIPTTIEEALPRIYTVLLGVEETVNYCHAREIKRGNSTSAITLSELRMAIDDRRHKIGVYLGLEEPVEIETRQKCALADAQ